MKSNAVSLCSRLVLSRACLMRKFKTWSRRSYYSYCNEPFQPLKRNPTWMKADEAVSVIKSGDTVFIQGAAATPRGLIPAMVAHGKKAALKNVTVCYMHSNCGNPEYFHPDCNGVFRGMSFFVGSDCREAINSGRADYVPVFHSEIPLLFERGVLPVDVALVHVSPPDPHGYCSLGTSVDCARSAVTHAKYIIGQVNEHMPRTFGNGHVHISHFDALVQHNAKLPEYMPSKLTDVEMMIAKHIAENLVENGATVQMGIGSIPDAVSSVLKNHKDLGVHSEMFSDGVVDLIEEGCITNSKKNIERGRTVASFCVGTQRLYDFVNSNPGFVMLDVGYVNDPQVIRENPKVTAINSCIEVDICGQVVSDSIGTKTYSDIEDQVHCSIHCREVQAVSPHDAVHFAGSFQGKAVLVVGSLSMWQEVAMVPTTFRMLLPSDNGPAFLLEEYRHFFERHVARRALVSRYHSTSNGQEERLVRIMKAALKDLSSGDVELCLHSSSWSSIFCCPPPPLRVQQNC